MQRYLVSVQMTHPVKSTWLFCLFMLLLLPRSVSAIELTGQDSGTAVTLSATETLSITLPGNPTTGYTWEIAAIDRELLGQDGSPSFTPDSSLVGAGGKFTYNFTPRRTGTGVIKLIYRRPWEKEQPPSQTFEVTVAVAAGVQQITGVSYRSSAGSILKATFDTDHDLITVIMPDGRSITLPLAPSASGARYSNGTETFWEHQGTGRFFVGDELVFEGSVIRNVP